MTKQNVFRFIVFLAAIGLDVAENEYFTNPDTFYASAGALFLGLIVLTYKGFWVEDKGFFRTIGPFLAVFVPMHIAGWLVPLYGLRALSGFVLALATLVTCIFILSFIPVGIAWLMSGEQEAKWEYGIHKRNWGYGKKPEEPKPVEQQASELEEYRDELDELEESGESYEDEEYDSDEYDDYADEVDEEERPKHCTCGHAPEPSAKGTRKSRFDHIG